MKVLTLSGFKEDNRIKQIVDVILERDGECL